jgi:hypothetical protein
MIMHYFGITDETPDEIMKAIFEDLTLEGDCAYFENWRTASTGYARLRSGSELKEVLKRIYKVNGDHITQQGQ